MARIEALSLRHYCRLNSAGGKARVLCDADLTVRIESLADGSSLQGAIAELAGRSALIITESQLASALALIELDGLVRRLTIVPPDIEPAHLEAVIAGAGIDTVVWDEPAATKYRRSIHVPVRLVCAPNRISPLAALPPVVHRTEWVMLTSGTSGPPKMVVHSLGGLTGAFAAKKPDPSVVWGTFHDVRRYGGLQIFLRSMFGGASFVLSRAGEPVARHLQRLAAHGVTHLSGTPSHWRRALMSPSFRGIAPLYVRLSGEIADQPLLDALRNVFPDAAIGHAYASTEAGLAFEVNDGREGFPAKLLGAARNGVELKVVDGSLRIRSPRAATRYIDSDQPLADPEGFIDSGDMIERNGDRLLFVGRKGGIINVGGLKVHPEEIEAVINRHPRVRMSLVTPKRNPITGSIVTANVVLQTNAVTPAERARVTGDILKLCREALPVYKTPAAISIVPELDVASSGKLVRRHG
jgi:acyl-coenzyme A synthetase/AMP-(fatty) acid ligase